MFQKKSLRKILLSTMFLTFFAQMPGVMGEAVAAPHTRHAKAKHKKHRKLATKHPVKRAKKAHHPKHAAKPGPAHQMQPMQ